MLEVGVGCCLKGYEVERGRIKDVVVNEENYILQGWRKRQSSDANLDHVKKAQFTKGKQHMCSIPPLHRKVNPHDACGSFCGPPL